MSVMFLVSFINCALVMTSYFDVVKAFKVQSRYGGDAAMDEVNVLVMTAC